MNDFADAEKIILLASALAIGLLIGIERGWKSREEKEGERVAGLRTYGLTGLLGGSAGLLSQYLGAIVFGFVFLGFAGAVTVAYVIQRRTRGDASITSIITMLLTFLLGALATLGHVNLAASAAVITALLLRFKDVLHGWLRRLEVHELHAALQLLLISIVLLPILPDQGYGPWQAFNPYETWWMVVLIASISFIGYFIMKIAGPDKGVILTALAAGMLSSTALTLHFSRLAKKHEGMDSLLAAGILVACGTMFPRIVLISTLINPALFEVIVYPMAVMALLTFSLAAVMWHQHTDYQPDKLTHMNNPLALKSALIFGVILVLVALLGNAAIHFFGETGIYLLAALSGIADVDPINLTLSRMSSTELSIDVAVLGIVIASVSNTLVKALLALFIGGATIGMKTLLPLFVVAGSGLTVAFLL
ncbi:MAG: hypothetical protein DRQ61_04035 [Gammaproteobacteria bacterium]|nr:MAG: hypothetical protein DRQ56_02630 [Gammaproteobacteria bacterium]RLA23370.1 MAG: hypothetical protein DRQ61_04035 [Gammaproteobacteria bacterium]